MKIRLTVALLSIGLAATPALADKKYDDAVKKADEKLRKLKEDEAVKTLEKLANQQADNPEAHIVLARLHEKMGNLDEAAAALDGAVRVSTSASPTQQANALAARVAMDLQVAAGQQALEHAEKAVAAEANANSLAALARAKVRVGDFPGALEQAEKAVAANPKSLAGQVALGEALLSLGRNIDAVQELRKAISMAPASECVLCQPDWLNLARTRLALALIADKRAPEALIVARQASEADQKSGEAFAVYGAAILADDKNNWNEAIGEAQMGTFISPKNPLIRVMVAQIFAGGGNIQQAETNYRHALQTDPAYAPAQVALIQVQVQRGDLAGAEKEAVALVQKAPQSGEAQLMLGTVRLRQGKYAEALEPLEMAAKYAPGNALSHAALGTAYQYAGQSEKGAESYRKAVEKDPENIDYQETFGLLLGLSGKYEEAIEVLGNVTSSPGYEDTAGFTNLGWVYRSMDPRQPEKSAAAYKKALQLDPKNAQAAIGMGWAHSYAKDYPAAISAFNQAIQIDPKTAGEANNGIAWCHYFSKEMDQAEAFAKKAQAAGRNVDSLMTVIEKYRTAVAEGTAAALAAQKKAEEDWEAQNAAYRAIQQAKKGDLGSIKRLGSLGTTEAVDALTSLLREPDRELQLAACEALSTMGATARPALKTLAYVKDNRTEWPTVLDKEQMEQQWLEGQVQRCAQEAIGKIR